MKQNNKQTIQREHLLNLFYQVSEGIAEAGAFNDVLKRSLRLICEFFSWPAGHAYFLDEKKNRLTPSNIWFVEDEKRLANLCRVTSETHFSRGAGLPGRVWESNQVTWIADVNIDKNFPRNVKCKDLKIMGGIAIPVVFRDKLVCVLEFFAYEALDEDLELSSVLLVLGKSLGVLFEHFQSQHLLEQTREDNLLTAMQYIQLIEEAAKFDGLTQLSNRVSFNFQLKHLIDEYHQSQSMFTLLLIDINRFKKINDTLGHHIGDQLLAALSCRLKGHLKASDLLGRVGGDEFGLILFDLDDLDDVKRVVTRISHLLQETYKIKGNYINMSVSIGVASFPESGKTFNDLMTHVDFALLKAKQGDGIQFYEEDLEQQYHLRMLVEARLVTAMEQNEFYLVFQPQVDMRNNMITGGEALLRWKCPDFGEILPDMFIPVAEQMGVVDKLNLWVVDKVVETFSRLRLGKKRDQPFKLAFNFSSFVYDLKRHLGDIVSVLQSTHFNEPNFFFELEVTESAIIGSINPMTKNLLSIVKTAGIKFALDDFGVKHSTLYRLFEYQFDTVKIDLSFVQALGHEKHDSALIIIRTVMFLAKQAGFDVIAEGVEEQKQADILIDLGCFVAQGFYYYKPMRIELLAALLEDGEDG